MSDAALAPGDTVDAKVLLEVLAQVREGDFTARMPLDLSGAAGKAAEGLNDVIIVYQSFEAELARVSQMVGKQGRLSQRLVLGGGARSWSGSVQSVNSLIDDLVCPTIELQRVIGAVADGDLSNRVSIDVKGEFLELKNTVNAMLDRLNAVAGTGTRDAAEVGVEGKVGRRAKTTEVGGVWNDLTDNVKKPDHGVFAGLKVLLVDDDFRSIFFLTAFLERGDAAVTFAESGSDAIAVLERTRDIDIVLMDILMPVMDGYDTIRAVRRFAHFRTLPIIAVTGKAVAGERQRCLDAGANDYVPKPVDVVELLAVLRPWLPGAAAAAL